MLPKGQLRRVWRVGLVACMVFSLMLLATVPLMAQEKSLEKQLEEARVAIEDQEWVIGQLEQNFFKVVAELNEELDFLRALSTKQLDEIESYVKEMGSLRLAGEKQAKRIGELNASAKEKAAGIKGKIAQLEAQKAEQARRLSELEEQAAWAEELAVLSEQQAERIERINTLFGKATEKMRNEIESLGAENAELIAAKDGLQVRLGAIEEKYAKLAEDYKGQAEALKRMRNDYQEALVRIDDQDGEIAFWEEQAGGLNIEIASVRSQLADSEAYNARLKKHRLLLGLAFVVAAVMACDAG